MAGPALILREIHRLRAHAQDLQSRIDLAPKKLTAQQSAVAKCEEELRQGQDAIKKLKVGIHEHEVSVKSVHQQIKRHEQQLNDITSKKEYDALKAEIGSELAKIGKLEDEALEAMSELEERTARLPALEAAVQEAKAEYAEFERDYQARVDSWVQQRDEVVRQIAEAEATLPSNIRQHYDRIIKAMGADALAAVEGKNCTACYTEITAQLAHNLQMQQFVMCRSCGRILYLKEEN
jgi:predicted  nucleic acid-binding Zn-ribbon protein